MTQDDLFRPEGDEPPPQKSSGCGMRFLLILLISVTGLSLLCCCGIGISLYSMAPKIEEDPAIAQKTLDRIMSITLPEGYEPKISLAMNVFSLINAQGVIIESASEKSILILARFKGSLIEQGDIVQQIEDAMTEEVDDSDMVIESQEKREFEINGQTVEFTFLKGRTTDSDGDEKPADPADADLGAPEEVPGGDDAVEPAETDPAASEEPAETPAAETPEEPAAENAAPNAAPAEEAAEAAEPEAEAPQGEEMRQVRAMIPSSDGPVLFLLIVPEDEWNEQDVVDMIESIELK
ncbi:MAG: hypothetical protein ACE37I_13370 [Rubinisphaera brasiliensis]|uniref:hypothetical protein n=1 Tax=Rubinisphaera brasiliensis TaxID=119 RepID=UPI00391CC9EC